MLFQRMKFIRLLFGTAVPHRGAGKKSRLGFADFEKENEGVYVCLSDKQWQKRKATFCDFP